MAKKSSAGKSSASKVDAFPPGTRVGVLYGVETFIKDQKLQEFKQVLEAQHGEIQTFFYDGKTASLADVLDEVRSYSLMQTYKLVIVDDADIFITGKRASEDDSKAHSDDANADDPAIANKREALTRYAQNPVDHATLIFRLTSWKTNTNLHKAVEVCGAAIECTPVSESTAIAWLQERALSVHGKKIEPRAAGTLVARLGTDLMQLDMELDKLITAAGKDQAVTHELVEHMVGRSSEEEAWAVQEAYMRAMIDGPANAIEKLHTVIELSGQAKVLVGYFVVDLARKIHTGAVMKSRGSSDFEIARELKFWGERQALLSGILRKVSVQKAARMFDSAVMMDVRSKTGLGDASNEPPRGLECLAVMFHDIAKSPG